MNCLSTMVMIAAVIVPAAACQADTLVITYKSGKTQTIVLDEPSQGINSWQFVGGELQQQSKRLDKAPAAAKQEQVQKDSATQPYSDVKAAEKAPEKKSGIRVKLNAKPIAD